MRSARDAGCYDWVTGHTFAGDDDDDARAGGDRREISDTLQLFDRLIDYGIDCESIDCWEGLDRYRRAGRQKWLGTPRKGLGQRLSGEGQLEGETATGESES